MTMQAADVALDLASVVCQSGGSTNLSETVIRNVLKEKNEEVAVVYRLDYLAASGVADGVPWTIVRPLGPAGLHLARASEAAILSERLRRGDIDLAGSAAEVERIKNLRSPHTRWTIVFAAACAGAAFSKMLNGDWGAFAIAFIGAGVGQFIRPLLQARKLSRYALTFVCALASGFLAVEGLRLGFSKYAAGTLIGSVIYMVPGVPLLNGFVEVTSGKHMVVGVQRLFDATTLFFILTVAVAIADSTL
jgi:uncharacterized membrane protein YjjP (DUF1212 family)